MTSVRRMVPAMEGILKEVKNMTMTVDAMMK